MKSISLILIALYFLTAVCSANDETEIPAFVDKGLKSAIQEGSFGFALSAWYRGNQHLSDTEELNNNIKTISRYEKRIGKPKSYQILGIDSPIDEIQVLYIALKHERGVYFMKLICFNDTYKWELKEYWYNTDPTKIPRHLLLDKRE